MTNEVGFFPLHAYCPFASFLLIFPKRRNDEAAHENEGYTNPGQGHEDDS